MKQQIVAGNKIWSKNNRDKKTRNKKNRNKKAAHHEKLNKRTLKYGIGILIFILMIVSALWLPQVFFEVSDALMYGEVSLMEQEKPDVLTLTTGYEESLFRRLSGFAEGLAGQRQYYVDEQPKEVTDEIREFLFESGLHSYANGIYEDTIIGMFTDSLGYVPETFVKKTSLDLYQWNQYVIYSDDYAQGVNFILWCFGLQNSLGDNMTILMDAHDYTVYAVQITGGTERSSLNVMINSLNVMTKSEEYMEYFESGVSAVKGVDYVLSSLHTHGFTWMTLNNYYEIFDPEEWERYYSEVLEIYAMWNKNQLETIAGVLEDCAGNEVEVYLDAGSGLPYGADGERWYGIGPDDIMYYSLPVQGNKITFDIYSFGEVYDAGQTINATMGIREIYELIPEFRHLG